MQQFISGCKLFVQPLDFFRCRKLCCLLLQKLLVVSGHFMLPRRLFHTEQRRIGKGKHKNNRATQLIAFLIRFLRSALTEKKYRNTRKSRVVFNTGKRRKTVFPAIFIIYQKK